MGPSFLKDRPEKHMFSKSRLFLAPCQVPSQNIKQIQREKRDGREEIVSGMILQCGPHIQYTDITMWTIHTVL